MTNDNKVYTPEVIEDAPFPQETVVPFDSSQSSANQVHKPTTTKEQAFPIKRVAVELISTVLNTKSRKILQEFQFTKSGAIQIGEYENGVSGDLRISPNGITARNISGITTFVIDGDTGDAVFAGEIRAGAAIVGRVVVGNNNIIIDGENKTIIVNDGTYDRVLIGYQAGGF